MFVPAKIAINEVLRLPQELIPSSTETYSDFYHNILQQVTNEENVINGSDLSALNFPFKLPHYHVFISYSHNDENDALRLFAFLSHRGLNCFLDSTVWHSADKLLEAIDHQYSWSDNSPNLFDYVKRNFSTSHVHAMLSMAMLEAIRRSELCVVIDSENSTSLKDGIEGKTLSPWIYEEVSFMKNIRIDLPERYIKPSLRTFSEGGLLEQRDQGNQLKVSYNINLENFISLKADELNRTHLFGTKLLDDIYLHHNVKRISLSTNQL